ncbi:MAG TPA: DNA recombination protein RmuC [Solirubrobacteraceae bacterium]
MGLLIAFVAGGFSVAVVFELARRRTGPGDDGMLEAFRAELFRFEGDQKASAAALGERMQSLGEHQATVLRQTGQLAEALRRPGVRGRWGELTLHNVVEAAGLAEHVDFDLQVHVPGGVGEAAARPDLVLRLPGGGHVPVDAKVTLDAYLDACQVDDPRHQAQHLVLHAKALRAKVRELSGKAYWERFERSPEMVILFMPSEAAFAAALQQDGGILEDAARMRVVIATPSTMLALLQIVGLGWREASMSEHAERIRGLASELVSRLGGVAGHLAKQGAALEQAVAAHNLAVGSFESRLLVSARRMGELGVQEASRIETPAGVSTVVRLPARTGRVPG